MSINSVIIIGRMTKDPELKYTNSNIAVCKFTLAVNKKYKQEGQPTADFIRCVAWKQNAENLVKFIKKGGQIGLTGYIQTGSYDDKDGKRVYTTDVVADSVQFLENKSDRQDDRFEPKLDDTLPFEREGYKK